MVMAVFEHLRVSLARPGAGPLFDELPEKYVPRDRLDYLTAAFSERRDFIHRQQIVTFLPSEAPAGYAAGYFGRPVTIHGHSGPEDHYEPTDLQTWDLSFLAIDLASDAQIALMQKNQKVGDPRALLKSFFESIRQMDGFSDYQIHVINLTSESSYFEAAEKFKGQITKIIFTFIPPNALRSEEKVAIFIKEASEDANNEILRHEYENRSGHLNPTADLLAGSEKVAAAGGGEAVMKSGRRTIFRSKDQKTKTSVSSEELPEAGNELQSLAFVARLFGKRK
jgi:hypothetical protein